MKRWLGISQRSVSHKLVVLSKIADGLDAIHSHDVVHRDIRSENIVMDSNEENATPAICDFDTSRDTSRDTSGLFGRTTTAFDGMGKKIGTIRYMAPEVFERQEKATKESDVWSFVIMCLIALVFDGKYDEMSMIQGGGIHNQDCVDISKVLEQAKRVISIKPLLDLFERVLGSTASSSDVKQIPSMKEIKNILMNADVCECALCKAETTTISSVHQHQLCIDSQKNMIESSYSSLLLHGYHSFLLPRYQ
jgi:serine/threonine protein kinase